MKYRPEIDGLRAIAVLPVILFHAGFEIFSGGFVGVDIFFVISGYLITTIILAEMEYDKFSLINFYERRARRILPALFFVMAVSVIFSWFWLLPGSMKEFSKSVLAVSTFSSNILFWKESDYFALAAELKPLLHTWSLAVEEQYYVFFPLFLMLTWRLGKQWIIVILAITAVLSLGLAQWGSLNKPTAAFYLLPTRGWELLIGAFTAFYLSKKKFVAGNHYASLLGLSLITYSIFVFDKQTPFPSVYTLVPTLGVALIILFTSSNTLTYKLLSNKVFVGIGMISYSAYLWHQPLFAFSRIQTHSHLTIYASLSLSLLAFLLAYFSWRFVEQPFRNRKKFNRKSILSFSTVASVAFITYGVIGYQSEGYDARFNVPTFVQDGEYDLPRTDNGWCFYSIDTIPALNLGKEGLGCKVGSATPKANGVLFGDSFAGQYEPFWDTVGKEMDLSVNAITTNWCYPSLTENFTGPITSRALSQCHFNRAFFSANHSSYDFIILGGAWASIAGQGKLEETTALIKNLAKNKHQRILIMASPTLLDRSSVEDSIYGRKAYLIPGRYDQSASKANNNLQTIANNHDNVIFINRKSLFGHLNGKDVLVTDEGLPFSWDGGHISIYGSRKSADFYLQSPSAKFLTSFLKLTSID